MSDNVEISLKSAESEALVSPKSPKRPRSRRRRIFIRVLLAFLFLLVLLFIAAWVLWINRNLVMEEVLSRQIAQRGFDAEMTVDEITDSRAQFRNVTLSRDGEFIFSADKIQASYLWPNVKSGELISLDIDGAKAALSLDEAGKINNDWLPESSGGAKIIFPPEGVRLNKSEVALTTPYGDMQIEGDITAHSEDNIEADISFAASVLTYRDDKFNMADKGGYFKGKLSGKQLTIKESWAEFDAVTIGKTALSSTQAGPINLKVGGALSLPGHVPFESGPPTPDYRYEGRLDLSGLDVAHPDITARAAQGAFEGTVQYDARNAAFDLGGALNLKAAAADYLTASGDPYAAAQDLSLSYEGQIARIAGEGALRAEGTLGLDAQNLGLTHSADARALAERLAIHKTLSATPVAQNFHADITGQIAQIFEGAQARARLSIDHDANGYDLGLAAPLQLRSDAQNSLTIRAAGGQPFLGFSAAEKQLSLNADLALLGARALDVKQLKLSGSSQNGRSFSAVSAASGLISSRSEWRGDDTRLAPFTADLSYGARGGATDLAVDTHIDFDGPLLGSDFTGLRASGRLRREGAGGDSALYFDPNAPIQIDNIVTQTGWSAQNVSAVLEAGAPLLEQSGGASPRVTTLPLRELRAIIRDRAGEQSFTVNAQSAQITGQESGASERWEAGLQGFDIRSDTTPGPGSRLNSSDMTLSLSRNAQINDAPWQYKLQTQALSADLAQLKLRELGIELSGQDSDFTATYQDGTVQIDGVELPPLPMTGRASYQDSVLSGTAETAMPRAARFPIYATYSYEDGVGSADLDIPEFIFSPTTIQPAELSPVLRGKIAQVSGLASAKVKLGYKAGEGVSSSGSVSVTDMDIGTLVGPFTGVSTTLTLDSLVPLGSLGTQTITMSGFNPGLPLGEGTVSFDVVDGGIAVREARWPLNTGSIYIEPTTWDTNGRVNRIIVRVENVSLGELIAQFGNENISATGRVNGTLPIVVDGVSVLVEGGNLTVKEGGVIRVRTAGLDAAGASNETAKIAIDALKEFEYKELSLDINGPLDGDMAVGAVFGGKNADVLGGADFLFRVNIEGELVNIAKSFANNAKVEEFLRVLDEELR